MSVPSLPLWRAALSPEVLARAGTTPTAVLNEAERGRWTVLQRSVDRDDFVAARLLVRTLLLESGLIDGTGEIRLRQRCSRCSGPHGRPEVFDHPRVFVSWAHSSGTVAAAVSDHPVGIDVESLDARVPSLGGRPRAVREWVRIESVVKARGLDLDDALNLRLDWPVTTGGRAFGEQTLWDAVDDRLAAAIAVCG